MSASVTAPSAPARSLSDWCGLPAAETRLWSALLQQLARSRVHATTLECRCEPADHERGGRNAVAKQLTMSTGEGMPLRNR
eukprot:352803-Chlamydomonas_euryale.AAC.4